MYLSQNQLNQITHFFADKPVKKVYLFGSYADCDTTEESDIDLLIDTTNDFRFLKFIGQVENLEKILNKKIDIVGVEGLNPNRLFTKFVNEQKKFIYEKI